MSGDLLPDVEGGMRTFLRNDTDVQAVLDQRVFFRPDVGAEFPLAAVYRVGGGEDPGEAPVDRAVIQIDVWGNLRNKAECFDAYQAVRKALSKPRSRTVLKTGVVAHGTIQVTDVRYLPDPEDNRPRYAITALVTATSTVG